MGNPVGSLEVPIVLRARKRIFLSMSPRQRDILIGGVLGDAYIAPWGKIRIEHSVKQSEYVYWKHTELKSLCYAGVPREVTHRYRGKSYRAIFLQLRQFFRPWRAIFYEGKQKIFPKNLSLNPLSLAVWYMDDGCWTGKKVVISTESFKGESIKTLQDTLKNQFDLDTVVGKNGKLVIRKKSHMIFSRLIFPHIIPSMKYKLPNPVTT
ncbi:MAG: hypothetical protein G01um101417_453 [Parcubacteria group bacterium Gr01-1014_17]|nr:MAG: hypothetical protein G01um101417_453 [Parcubacteria group bacterium Gr01-1014_17]